MAMNKLSPELDPASFGSDDDDDSPEAAERREADLREQERADLARKMRTGADDDAAAERKAERDRINGIEVEAPRGDDRPATVLDADENVTLRRARAMGWRPKGEWHGDPAKWKPAAEFVEIGLIRGAQAAEVIDRQAATIEQLTTRSNEQQAVLSEMNKRLGTAAAAGYARAKAELELEMRTAVSEADPEKFDDAKAKLDALEEPEPIRVAEPATAPRIDQAIQDWNAAPEQRWFRENKELSEEAVALYRADVVNFPKRSIADRLIVVRNKMAALHPDEVDGDNVRRSDGGENPRRSARGSVRASTGERGGRSSAGKEKRGVADLPEEDRRQMEKWKRTIPGFTEKEFLDSYDWD